jgi:hypothetical protein
MPSLSAGKPRQVNPDALLFLPNRSQDPGRVLVDFYTAPASRSCSSFHLASFDIARSPLLATSDALYDCARNSSNVVPDHISDIPRIGCRTTNTSPVAHLLPRSLPQALDDPPQMAHIGTSGIVVPPCGGSDLALKPCAAAFLHSTPAPTPDPTQMID